LNLKSTAIALPLVTMASLASAQNVEYLSYGAAYINSDDADVFGLGGTIDYRNSNFVLNGGVGYADLDGLDGNDDVTTLDFRAGYFVTQAAVIYGGYSYTDTDGDDSDAYNIGGEYNFNQFTVGLNFEDIDESGVDTFSTIYAGYQVTNELELGLQVSDQDDLDTVTTLTADYDLGDTELFAVYSDNDSGDFFAINGNYDFQNGFRVGGGYTDLDSDVELISISGGYEIAENLWIDASYGNLDIDGASDEDVFGLAISFETGRETLLVDRLDTVQTEALGVLGSALAGPRF